MGPELAREHLDGIAGLDDAEGLRLPAGTQGDAAVYSGNVQIAGVIRMAVMRMTSWTNYLYFTS